MRRILKLRKYVSFACILVMSIFAARKAIAVSNDDVKKTERDIVSIMKRSNPWPH